MAGRALGPVTIEVSIPAGIRGGQTIRVRGQGRLAPGGGERGDLLLQVGVGEHPIFRRRGENIESDVKVSGEEAESGVTRTVPILEGEIELKIPAGTKNGSLLKAGGCGIVRGSQRGDHLFRIQIQ